MGLGDVLFGRKKLKGPARDRLFALTTAAVTLDVECGLKPAAPARSSSSRSRPATSRGRERRRQLLQSVATDNGSKLERKQDSFGYEWVIVRDPDLEDQVTAVYGVANGLTEQGFGAQLLAAAFRFDGGESPVYWIYGFKTGTFWPFVPKGKEQERDNPRELELKAKLEKELPVEADLTKWFACSTRRSEPVDARHDGLVSRPTPMRDGPSRGRLREGGEALLHRRVIHEELADLLAPVRRDDEEGVHAGDLAQVLLRDLRDAARDLLQRAHQVLRRAGDERGAAVGRVLAVARDRADEDEADRVGDDRDGEDDQPDRHRLSPLLLFRPPPPPKPPNIPM